MFTTEQDIQKLPEWLRIPYQNLTKEAEGLAREPYAPYPGRRLADLPPDLVRAHNLGRQTGLHEPYVRKAEALVEGTRQPFHMRAKEYMNPYQKQVVEQIANEGNRNFTENVMPAIEAKFLRLGQHGGSRHADLSLRAARDLQREIMERQAQAMASGYQQAAQIYNADQARALEGARSFGDLGALTQAGQLSDVAMLENQGRYQQQQNQASHDVGYEDWLRQKEHPFNKLAWYNSMLHGIPHPGITSHWRREPATPQMNVLGQLGPLAGMMWAARQAGGK